MVEISLAIGGCSIISMYMIVICEIPIIEMKSPKH